MTLFDTHAHLDQPEFHDDCAAVVERAHAAGVTRILCVGVSAASSAAAIRLAETHPSIYAAVGIHPNYGHETQAADWDAICRLAEHPRVVAIGETGLDRHWDTTPFALQRDLFARHLELARSVGRPVVIHCREAEDDVRGALEKAAAAAPIAGIMHAFSGDAAWAAACIGWGLHVSFAGPVTFTNKSADGLRAAAQSVPLERILVETDSPYLVPHPLRGKQKRNEPALVVHTARRLAELRGMDEAAFAAQATGNALRLFRLAQS